MKLFARALATVSVQLFLLLFVNAVSAQNKSESPADDNSFKRVLLVKEDSYLETAVGKILIDSLTRKGFSIKTINPKSLKNENSGAYRAIILFNAIKSSGLISPVRQLMNATSGAQTNVLISTIYGEPWDKNKHSEDAVAAATKSLNPELVAAKLLAHFNMIIERDTATVARDTAK
jgi:hypothetical protein